MYSSAFAGGASSEESCNHLDRTKKSVRLIPFVEDIVTKLTPCGIKHPDNVNEEKTCFFYPHSVQKYILSTLE